MVKVRWEANPPRVENWPGVSVQLIKKTGHGMKLAEN
jgi:hypothetical protein